jgi:glyoxylase-like metal-dependent hydrolase (beta-lactamase superfamily II)
MTPLIRPYFDPATATVTYLVADPATRRAAIIDPVWDYDPASGTLSTAGIDAILAAASGDGFGLDWALDTHAHADHLTAADYVRRKTGAKIGIGARITVTQQHFRGLFHAVDVSADGRDFDRLFEDGDTFQIGSLSAQVLHTPGHTPACVTYVIGDAAFVGDTIFQPDYGTARTDFPGGDAATLYRSIHRILSLPAETRIFTGHDYLPAGRSSPAWESTVAEQRAANIHIHEGVSESAFVALRRARDVTLKAPALILPSLQVNIRAGALPPPEDDGRSYLKIPVTCAA